MLKSGRKFIFISFQIMSVNTGYAQLENLDIFNMTIEELMNINVITASKFEQSVSKAPSVMTVITKKDINNYGVRHFEDLMRLVVGADPLHFDKGHSISFNMRGLPAGSGNERIQILIDGHFFRNWLYAKFIPIEMIERVEIVRGPGSVLYGTNSLIGVINIITKKSPDRKGAIGLTAGSFGTFNVNVRYRLNGDSAKFLQTYVDHYRTTGPRRIVESDFATQNFGPSLSLAPGYTNYGAEVTSVDLKGKYGVMEIAAHVFHRKTDNITGLNSSLINNSDNSEKELSFYLQPLLNVVGITKNNFTVRPYINFTSRKANYQLLPATVTTFFNNQYGNGPQFETGEGIQSLPSLKTTIYGLEVVHLIKFSDRLKVLNGVVYQQESDFDVKLSTNANLTGDLLEVNGEVFQPFQAFGQIINLSSVANFSQNLSRHTGAIYSEASWVLIKTGNTDRVFGTIGLRGDFYEDIGSTINPRFSFAYNPIPDLFFKYFFGTAFRAPDLKQLNLSNNPALLGNPFLEPESISTNEFQVNFQKNRSSIAITFFHSKMKGLIAVEDSRFENLEKITSKGIEIEGNKRFTKLDMFANLILQRARNVSARSGSPFSTVNTLNQKFRLASVPDVIFNFGITQQVKQIFLVSLSNNIISRRPRSGELTDIDGQIVLSDPRESLPARILTNFQITYKPTKVKQLEFRAGLYNLLGFDHRDPVNSGFIENDIPRAGRSTRLNVKYRF